MQHPPPAPWSPTGPSGSSRPGHAPHHHPASAASTSASASYTNKPLAPLRSLPSFGSPNEFPNPPSHYFPSRPRAVRAKSPPTRSDAETVIKPRQPRSAPLADGPTSVEASSGPRKAGSASHGNGNPKANGVVAGHTTSSARWERAGSATRDELDDGHAMDADGEGDDDSESVADVGGDRDDDGVDEGEGSSSHNAKRGASGAAGFEKDGAKKRSRTLTSAHQTAVLNSLLAKVRTECSTTASRRRHKVQSGNWTAHFWASHIPQTRFPSTETREEVGKQIGMSARRVQIWFQNRRQSQKRVRDREASEMGAASTSSLPHHEYQRNEPYTRYGAPPASSASSSSTARPNLSRQVSAESNSSFASAYLTRYPRDPLSPLSDGPPRWSGGSTGLVTGAGYAGWLNSSPERRPPTGTYSSNHIPGRHQAGPFPGPPAKLPATTDGAVRLPSLSAVLGPAIVDSNAERTAFAYSHPHSRGPPLPSSAGAGLPEDPPIGSVAQGTNNRPFDDFSRLRISNDGPSQCERRSSPPDILDAAMETMFRPAAFPARSKLPPLRSTLGLGAPLSEHEFTQRSSEADAALLAPIRPAEKTHTFATRLPPISALALAPSNVFPSAPRTPGSASHRVARSSVSSLDTLGTWSAGVGAHGQVHNNASAASSATSRTSFSSEVQEEWDRMTSGVGRKVKTAEVSLTSQPNSRRIPSGFSSREVRMGSP
ncbi:BZ3500_MvSof-1268-A1-R1_Chr1-2g01291 [Microbotryum saponariae]|uniref:BZ3500_MvSof-1268-A1-R1_Chr1-2g01291 protein n=1 Tax=Microbotryum saponariae TaxID=289078 RepID=A0A2X0MAW3_9BASI|nr:BZ3500_MvSof-1268-A1-R1_Chr1-2g01291 [Microbotryum saponariae]SCZ96995.1 BZ3501_MvSof-1269-A2-R1_Chr1-2g00889 [Microbotryum saponariae]